VDRHGGRGEVRKHGRDAEQPERRGAECRGWRYRIALRELRIRLAQNEPWSGTVTESVGTIGQRRLRPAGVVTMLFATPASMACAVALTQL
jgi:hypothetical protein